MKKYVPLSIEILQLQNADVLTSSPLSVSSDGKIKDIYSYQDSDFI